MRARGGYGAAGESPDTPRAASHRGGDGYHRARGLRGSISGLSLTCIVLLIHDRASQGVDRASDWKPLVQPSAPTDHSFVKCRHTRLLKVLIRDQYLDTSRKRTLEPYVPEEVRKRLIVRGWALLSTDYSVSLLDIATNLGEPIPTRRGSSVVDHLTPTRKEQSTPNSFSALYGTGQFPFHTDCSYTQLPPRFMLLRLAEHSTSDRPTILVDTHNLAISPTELKTLYRDVWLVNGGRGRFFTSIMNDSLIPGAVIVRFDPRCMKPALQVFADSASILQRACDVADHISIDWSPGRALIIDNWRMLHARGVSSQSDSKRRILERVLVTQLQETTRERLELR